MKLLLTNEERLRRRRARWARQAAERREPDGEFKAPTKGPRVHQSRAGIPDRSEKLISDAQMKAGWRYFWDKRGLSDLPSTTTAGVIR